MTPFSHRWRKLSVGIAAILVATLTTGFSPASAQEDAPPSDAPPPEAPSCEVELGTKLVKIPAVWPNGRVVERDESAVIPLAEPLSGTVVASGITGDLAHLEDEFDGTFRLTQFEEQIKVEFLDAAGDVIATTVPTPDLPDLTPAAPFNLPSVELDRPAVAVKIVHAGVTESEPNSIAVPCVNFKALGADSHPSDYVTFNLCPFDAAIVPGTICGFLSVPEDRDVDGSRLISVAFAIVLGDGSSADPLVYLEGGPGGAPINLLGLRHEFGMAAIAGGRDVIYIDQRGTGYSQPNLVCTTERQLTEPPPVILSAEEALAFQQSIVERCFDRLDAEGVNINGFTTPENAADVADLRVALGISEWNLFGGSYGTNVGLTIMRDRPEGVRSVVLDSVFPPEVNVAGGGDQGIGFLKQLDAIAARCDADAACSADIPDLRTDIIAAVDNLNAEPVIAVGTEAEFLFGIEGVPFDGFLLLQILNQQQNNRFLAAAVHAAADDNPAVRAEGIQLFLRAVMFDLIGLPLPEQNAALTQLRLGIPGPASQFSDGFFDTVVCAEEFPFATGATSYDGEPWGATIEAFASSMVTASLAFRCPIVDIAPEDPIVNEPITSDIRTLVTYTDNDSQTVPEWSELTASRLPNAELVFFPNLAHVVAFSGPCPQSVIGQFVANPNADLDTSCVADLPTITYVGTLPNIPPLPPIDEFFAQLAGLAGEDGAVADDGDGAAVQGTGTLAHPSR